MMAIEDRRKIARMTALLEELEEFFDDEVDIEDGENGPRPNDAMRWQQRIREVLGKERF
jgi:hypothetical protein